MPDPDPTPDPTPVALVNADGTFSENWKESLPEEIRGDKSLDVVTDFNGLVSQHINAQKMLGKDKVVLPGPNATDEERGAFYDAIGRPATAGDYKVEVPEELKEVFTPERMAKAQEIAHKIGATKEQYEGYMQQEFESAAEILGGQTDTAQAQWDADEKEIRARLGAAREERVHIANRLIAEICKGDEGKERQLSLLKKFQHDPDFIEFASDCGAKLISHKALIAELTVNTPGENEKRIAEINATPGFIIKDAEGKFLADTNPTQKKALLEERQRLTEETYPEARPARPGY